MGEGEGVQFFFQFSVFLAYLFAQFFHLFFLLFLACGNKANQYLL